MSDIGVVHLVRKKNGMVSFRRFLESYQKNPAGVDHDLLIPYKDFHRKNDIISYEELLDGNPEWRLKFELFAFGKLWDNNNNTGRP